MSQSPIRFELSDGIVRLTMANPANRNAVDGTFVRALREAAVRCEVTPGLRCILLRAEGDLFSVGGDLREFIRERPRIQSHVKAMTVEFHAAIAIFNRLPVPFVVALHGMAAGGGASLVCMSDLAIAARSAKLNFAYTRSGLTPDGGATWFLPRLVGAQRAFDLLATNPTLDATAAAAMGLIARVVDDVDFEAEVERVVKQLASMPSGAIGELRKLLRASFGNSLTDQLELEGSGIAVQAANPETCAALDAFMARSAANDTGSKPA